MHCDLVVLFVTFVAQRDAVARGGVSVKNPWRCERMNRFYRFRRTDSCSISI
jgi:hypothetical protein